MSCSSLCAYFEGMQLPATGLCLLTYHDLSCNSLSAHFQAHATAATGPCWLTQWFFCCSSLGAYLKDMNCRHWAFLAGAICGVGNTFQFM